MFPKTFFAKLYFPGLYFPPIAAIVPSVTNTPCVSFEDTSLLSGSLSETAIASPSFYNSLLTGPAFSGTDLC
jgi:hypothetical protein